MYKYYIEKKVYYLKHNLHDYYITFEVLHLRQLLHLSITRTTITFEVGMSTQTQHH